MGSAVGGTMALEDEYVAVSNTGKDWLVDHTYGGPFLYQALVPSQPRRRTSRTGTARTARRR